MKNSFFIAAIVGFSALGSAHASGHDEQIQFMLDDELQQIHGTKLRHDLTKKESLKILNRIVRRDRMIYDDKKREKLYSYYYYLISDKNPFHYDAHNLKADLKRRANKLLAK